MFYAARKMKKLKKINLISILQFLGNLGLLILTYYGVFYLKLPFGKPYTASNLQALKIIFPWIIASFIILYFVYRINRIMEADFYEMFLGIVFSLIILALLTLALSFFLRAFAFPRSAIIYSLLIQLFLLTGFNYIIYSIYLRIIVPIDLLYLSCEQNNEYIKYFETAAENLFKIKNVKINDKTPEEIEKTLKEFKFILIDNKIEMETKEKILVKAILNDKKVYVVPGIYELMLLNTNTHFVGEFPILETNSLEPPWVERLIKRLLDLLVSIIALTFFSPLLIIVSILIICDSGFPILYMQERAGAKGKIFKTIKFRTMIKNAENDTGPVLSNENDRRITGIGRFLRKSGIDEIPQFINVLKGDMSIVGPRPERPEIIEEIMQKTPEFELRLNVKPGITGFAQLTGKYDTPFDKKLAMDLLYTKQRFIPATDLFIMLNTLKLFFSPKKRK
jgi:exopolysaccharide biosynthesis polyprenyl glycosylphosphotransferase